MAYYNPPIHNLTKFDDWQFNQANSPEYLDGLVVHKAGTETITGNKTFTSKIVGTGNIGISGTGQNLLTTTTGTNTIQTTAGTGSNTITSFGGSNILQVAGTPKITTTSVLNTLSNVATSIESTNGNITILATNGTANILADADVSLVSDTGISLQVLAIDKIKTTNILNTLTNESNTITASGGLAKNTLSVTSGQNELEATSGTNKMISGNVTFEANSIVANGLGGGNYILSYTGQNTIQANGGNVLTTVDGDNVMDNTNGTNKMTSTKPTFDANWIDATGSGGGNYILADTGNNTIENNVGDNSVSTVDGDNVILSTNGTNNFLSSNITSKANYLQIDSLTGGNTLETLNGDNFLQNANGKNWLQSTGSGENWLQCNTGQNLLSATTGSNSITTTAGTGDNTITSFGGSNILKVGATAKLTVNSSATIATDNIIAPHYKIGTAGANKPLTSWTKEAIGRAPSGALPASMQMSFGDLSLVTVFTMPFKARCIGWSISANNGTTLGGAYRMTISTAVMRAGTIYYDQQGSLTNNQINVNSAYMDLDLATDKFTSVSNVNPQVDIPRGTNLFVFVASPANISFNVNNLVTLFFQQLTN